MKITQFKVIPFHDKWLWLLYVDGFVKFKGETKHQTTALIAGCFKWAVEGWRAR